MSCVPRTASDPTASYLRQAGAKGDDKKKEKKRRI